MSARIIPYRSRRVLSGLGETTASEAGNYAAYARAIYQAINGDVVGGAYNAAITFAGPIAAIGNAIANFLNRSGDVKSAATSALIDAFAAIPGWHYIGGRVPMLITPGTPQCYSLRPDDRARDLSEAIRKQQSPDVVEAAMRAWLATKKPWYGVCTPLENVPAPLPASVPTPVTVAPSELPPGVAITPTPAPLLTPAPQVAPPVQTFQPAPMLQTIQPAPSIASPDVVVNLPASVPPDQTPLLIQQLISQGATQTQAMTAALKSLAARGVPATPAVQNRVASDVRASALQINSPAGMIILAAIVLGFTWWVSEQS